MQDTSELVRPYAIAAFQQADEEGKLSEWSDMLALLGTIVSAPLTSDALSPEAFRYANPGISWSSPARTDCECTPPSAGNRRA